MEKTVENKSFQFAVRIVKLYKYLNDRKNEHTHFQNNCFGPEPASEQI